MRRQSEASEGERLYCSLRIGGVSVCRQRKMISTCLPAKKRSG
jgi:hypothetical protein